MALGHVPIHPGARRLLRLEVSPGSFKASEPGIQTIQEFLPMLLRLEVAHVGKDRVDVQPWTWDVTRVVRYLFFCPFCMVIISSYEYIISIYVCIPWIQHLSTSIKRSKFVQNIPKPSLWNHITLPHLGPSSFSTASCKTCCSCSGNSLMAWLGYPTRAQSYYVNTVFVRSSLAMHLSQVKTCEQCCFVAATSSESESLQAYSLAQIFSSQHGSTASTVFWGVAHWSCGQRPSDRIDNLRWYVQGD